MKALKSKSIYISGILFVLGIVCITFTSSSAQGIEYHIGLPYIANPLGEGENSKYDNNPLYRADGFDCTTYVENILAQHVSQTKRRDFMETLLRLRYIDAEVDFFSRAHIMESDWIPNAIKQQFIAEHKLHNAQKSELVFPVREWFLNQKHIKNKDDAYIQRAQTFSQYIKTSVPFVPKEQITAEFLKTLPDFMVVFFLRKPVTQAGVSARQYKTANAAQITHMGLLKKGTLYHASSVQKKVVAVNLLDYINKQEKCVGVSFYVVR